MSDAFISYARKDARIVNRLVGELRAAGVDPWIDDVNIPGGQRISREIQRELEAATCVLGCWTENAHDSDYVRDECEFAKTNGKLIPVLLQSVRSPLGYGDLRHYDLVGWMNDPNEHTELDRLIASIKARRQAQRTDAGPVERTGEFKILPAYPPGFDSDFKKAASALLHELSWIDQEYQFQKDWFTPLNADAEVHKGGGLDDRKIMELLKAITKDRKSPMFLVVGEPGAGKSVAMRELAREGLRLASKSKTKVLPIYVNLREWAAAQKWTQHSPPDTRALRVFLDTRLGAYDNPFLRDFFREYLDRLHMDGRIFWIFDSFDEIPAVLDAAASTEPAWIIRTLSIVLWRFVTQGTAGRRASRGVIASRPQRSPDFPGDQATRLDVRPFGEDRIDTALRKVTAFPPLLISTLLNARPDLLPLARTPFYLGLIADFGARQAWLPRTQVEMFEAYILGQLGSDALRVQDVTDPAVTRAIHAAEDMARFLLTSSRLEAPREELRATFPGIDIDACIERLMQARIMRKGRPPVPACSFAHRRIQEYFAVRHMRRTHAPFDHEGVATDSKMRDAAVLYVELAGDEEARQIAECCWQEIATQPPDEIDYAKMVFWRALRCQRFLAEAFRARLPALDTFRGDMAARVRSLLADGTRTDGNEQAAGGAKDLITMKLAVETLGLLPEESIPDVLGAALQNGDPWIRETAVNASRFLPKVRPYLAGRIWRSIAAMPENEFRREHTRLLYAFKLSSGLSEIGKLIRLRARDDWEWRWIGRWIAGSFRFWHLLPVWIWRELMLRHPEDELSALPTAEGKTLADLEYDRSGGLSGYRKVLASTLYWRDASIVMFLGIILIIAYEAYTTVGAPFNFGHGYDFAAVIEALQERSVYIVPAAFMAASLWIAPWFAGRIYPLVLPGENIPPRTWKDRLAGLQRWGGWGSVVLVSFVGGALVVGGVILVNNYLVRAVITFIAGSEPAETITKSMLTVFFWGLNIFSGIWLLMVATAGLTALTGSAIRWLRDRETLVADRARLEAFANGDNSTRARIADHFMAFKTDKIREQFVRRLGAQRLEVQGEWPEGRPPNRGDNASSLLARLEHRWRHLDR